MQDNKNYRQLYIIAEMRYKDDNPTVDSNNLFPLGWHLNDDYKLKILIIAEALEKHILISNTDLYKANFIESVVSSNNR